MAFAIEEVTRVIEDALQLGTIGFDAAKHLLLCRIERRPPRLDMEIPACANPRRASWYLRRS